MDVMLFANNAKVSSYLRFKDSGDNKTTSNAGNFFYLVILFIVDFSYINSSQ